MPPSCPRYGCHGQVTQSLRAVSAGRQALVLPQIHECQISELQSLPPAAKLPHSGSGRSVAWLARLFRVQEVVSSNLTAPTIYQFSIADCRLPNGNSTNALTF